MKNPPVEKPPNIVGKKKKTLTKGHTKKSIKDSQVSSSKELEIQAKKHKKASKRQTKPGTVREKVPVKGYSQRDHRKGSQQDNALEISGKNTFQSTTFQQNKQSVLAIDGAFDISKEVKNQKDKNIRKIEVKKKDSSLSLRKADLDSSESDSLYDSDDESDFSDSEHEFNDDVPAPKMEILAVKEKEELEPLRDRDEVYFTGSQHAISASCQMLHSKMLCFALLNCYVATPIPAKVCLLHHNIFYGQCLFV